MECVLRADSVSNSTMSDNLQGILSGGRGRGYPHNIKTLWFLCCFVISWLYLLLIG